MFLLTICTGIIPIIMLHLHQTWRIWINWKSLSSSGDLSNRLISWWGCCQPQGLPINAALPGILNFVVPKNFLNYTCSWYFAPSDNVFPWSELLISVLSLISSSFRLFLFYVVSKCPLFCISTPNETICVMQCGGSAYSLQATNDGFKFSNCWFLSKRYWLLSL